MSKTKTFRLAYRIVNGGDRRAYPSFHKTEKEAETKENQEIEEGMDGWGESSAGSLDLRVVDGTICRRVRGEFVPPKKGQKHGSFLPDTWEPLEEVGP